MKDITELKKNLTVLQEEKMNLTEINEKISYQLKMKEIQIVLNQEELKKKSDENLEEGEIENPLKIEENLTENEIALVNIFFYKNQFSFFENR